MKNIKILSVVSVFIVAAILGSCVKEDFTYPPQKVYTVNFDTNTTISELKAMYNGIPLKIETEIVISGTVISNDQYGNFYKKLVVQDSTGGIEIEIDDPAIYAKYPVGSLVYIKCKDLVLDLYRGFLTLNYNSNGSFVRMPSAILPKYIYRVDGGRPIVPKKKWMSDLSEKDYNTLVQFENVQFIDTDTALMYSNDGESGTDRTIEDNTKTTMIVRSSGYGDLFKNANIPNGSGSITAVFNIYQSGNNTIKQLFLRDLNDVNLTQNRNKFVLDEKFNSSLGVFSKYNVTGTIAWKWSNAGGAEQYASMEGKAQGANEDWLISPALNLSTVSNPMLGFSHAVNYIINDDPNQWSDISVWVSKDYSGTGDPNLATWTELTGWNRPSGNSWAFVNSGTLSLASYVGNSSVYCAFRYKSSTSAGETWEITSVAVLVQ